MHSHTVAFPKDNAFIQSGLAQDGIPDLGHLLANSLGDRSQHDVMENSLDKELGA